MRVRLLDDVSDLAEDADDVVAVTDGDRADLDRDAGAVGAGDDHARIGDLGRP